jgi:hypothetical protein
MEVLSRGRTIHLTVRLAALMLLAGGLPEPAWADPPNVLGTWHVVVEYMEHWSVSEGEKRP